LKYLEAYPLWQCFGEFLEKGKQSKLSITIDNRIKSWFKNYNDKEMSLKPGPSKLYMVFILLNISSLIYITDVIARLPPLE